MQAVLAPHLCQGVPVLRPLGATSHSKNALVSAFVHKPSFNCSIATTPIRSHGIRQSNIIVAASAIGSVFGGLLDKLKGVKVDSSTPEWNAVIYTTGELAKERPVLDFLDLELVSEAGRIDAEKEGKDLAKWDRGSWTSLDKRQLGNTYSGKVRIPTSIGKPQVALFKHTGGADNPMSFYISRLVLSKSGEPSVVFAVNSWIHAKQGPRVFFEATPCLPSQTSKFLQEFREKELAELRGPPIKSDKEPRNEWDRVYQFDFYNDLGNPEAEDTKRPVLGGRIKGGKFAYPRRLRTARGLYKGGPSENPLTKDEPDFWLPQDEKFDPLKQANFSRGRDFYGLYALNGILSMVTKDNAAGLPSNLQAVKAGTFPDFEAYHSLFKDREGVIEQAGDKLDAAIAKALPNLDKSRLESLGNAFGISASWGDFVANAKKGNFKVNSDVDKLVAKLRIVIEKLTFSPPFVWDGREELWKSDEEWGRETLAGQNPCVIAAITSLPDGTKITAKDLEANMGGITLAEALASPTPRVFAIDYSVIYPEYSTLINCDTRHQYAGRAILFLRDDQQLVPIAIELFTKDEAPVVYTPSDPANVWLVAKHCFSSIDSGFHQLYSHWCRTHACMEPALIAMRRQLSALHPVYKLLMPHFRFTLNINKNARQTLISSGGIIEKSFTPGKHSLSISAEAYGALWTFEGQALPNDLIARGMAKKGADGKVEVLVPEYPYANDGLLVWEGVKTWVHNYLSLYYTGEPGKTIKDDPEINAWWSDFKNEGHADVTGGWPKLETVADLTEILTTIIWVVSAHHAAVNFGQYDYSGYVFNRPSIVHKAIPAKGTPGYKDLVQNLERTFFKIFSGTKEAIAIMATTGLLSTHAENEQYIGDKEHFYIFDSKARELYDAHVKHFEEIESEITQRNTDPHSIVRNREKGGLPYTLLLPTSESGVTGRGIPTSISI